MKRYEVLSMRVPMGGLSNEATVHLMVRTFCDVERVTLRTVLTAVKLFCDFFARKTKKKNCSADVTEAYKYRSIWGSLFEWNIQYKGRHKKVSRTWNLNTTRRITDKPFFFL
jgi:hypothetical protein